MAHKMKGFPKMDTSSKHGTNKDYAKSGAPGFFGNLLKGKGALGFLNPLGAIASKIGGKAGKILNPAGMLAFRNAFPDLIEKMLVSLNDRPLGDLGAGTFTE